LQVFVLHTNFSLPFRQGCVKLISLCLCFSYEFVSVWFASVCFGWFFGVGFVLVGLIGLFVGFLVLSGLFCVMDIEYELDILILFQFQFQL